MNIKNREKFCPCKACYGGSAQVNIENLEKFCPCKECSGGWGWRWRWEVRVGGGGEGEGAVASDHSQANDFVYWMRVPVFESDLSDRCAVSSSLASE